MQLLTVRTSLFRLRGVTRKVTLTGPTLCGCSALIINLCGQLLVRGGPPCVVSCIVGLSGHGDRKINAFMPADLGIGRT